MSQSFTFYNQRANEAAADAEAAQLDNVRDRALRSEKTWRGLASQAKKLEEDRAKAEAERTERRAREAEEADALAAEQDEQIQEIQVQG